MKLTSMCECGKDFCDNNKICAVDQCLLMKLVLHTSNSIAQRKLMKVLDFDLPAAMQMLKTCLTTKNYQRFN